MSNCVDDHKTAMEALDRLYAAISTAAQNIWDLEDKERLVRLARRVVECRTRLKTLYYMVRDAEKEIEQHGRDTTA